MILPQSPTHLSANIIACETVLSERTEIVSAVRILNVLAIGAGNNFARFSTLTFVTSQPGDLGQHNLQVRMQTMHGELVAQAPGYPFVYGYKIDLTGPGAFMLTTNFNIDLTP